MNKKYLAIATLIIIGIGGLYLWQLQNLTKQFSNNEITFNYQKNYKEESVAAGTKDAKPIVKLGAVNPRITIELNKEIGAMTAANMLNKPLIDVMEYGAGKKMPQVYSGYSKVASERIKASGYDVSVLDFRYTGTDKKTTLYARLFMIPFKNDAYYLTIQSSDKNRYNKDADLIKDSLKISL